MMEEHSSERPPAPAPKAPKKKAKAKPKAKTKAKGAADAGRAVPRSLASADIEAARVTNRPWDRASRFGLWDYFVHAKFGVGHVVDVSSDGFIVCLFEDGETRKLIHAR